MKVSNSQTESLQSLLPSPRHHHHICACGCGLLLPIVAGCAPLLICDWFLRCCAFLNVQYIHILYCPKSRVLLLTLTIIAQDGISLFPAVLIGELHLD